MTSSDEVTTPAPAMKKPTREKVYRHTRVVRATHWINAICLFFLVASGAQIFNAFPALHWGKKGFGYDNVFVSMRAEAVDGHARGITRIGSLKLDTTGLFGLSANNGQMENRAFPNWMTIPSWRDLAVGRRWHFFFAWIFVISGLVYLTHGFSSRHFARDLAPTKEELKPQHLWHEIVDHAQLKFPKGEAAKRYNALQKLAYGGAVFILLPLMLLTGLTMSPGFNAVAPILLDLFGGRQSARTLHFISAFLIVAFVFVHLAMVVLSGLVNNVRSMITGQYEIEPERQGP
jgi:thiosulfate reductase cytochrome b subunit